VLYYTKVGFKPSQIFEFAYFTNNNFVTDQLKSNTEKHSELSEIIKVLYVGQLTTNKNITLLLKVLSHINAKKWVLNIIGDGPEKQFLVEYCRTHDLNDRVNFLGNMSHDNVTEYYHCSDFLVLPSKHEGWGAVVAEAFDAGLPSIVSDKCGAAVINKYCKGGSVFRSGDFHSLKKAILKQFALIKQESSRIVCVTDHLQSHPFSAKSGALYLEAIINQVQYSGSKPLPPWKT
jgi:glycosyltransferase involved in cell wall biosynthesis